MIAGGAILLALRAPVAAVVVNGLAVGGYFAFGLADGPIFVSIPLVAFVAAQRVRARPLLPFVAAALAAVGLGLTLRAVEFGAFGWQTATQVIGTCGVVLAAALLGWLLQDRREARLEQARQVATEEQLRMAQDLHDGVGHALAIIAMQAGVALHVLDRDPAKSRESLEAIRATSRDALEALRRELAQIGPDRVSTRLPARTLAGLEALLDRVRRSGLTVELVAPPEWSAAPGSLGASLGVEADAVAYAVVQESLTNVLRHAEAHRAVVELDLQKDTVVITVTDDGSSATVRSDETNPETDNDGMGISGMRSRLARLGGTLEAGPMTGGGWRIRASFPAANTP